eukprot:1993632-Amphidinium_carterae.1
MVASNCSQDVDRNARSVVQRVATSMTVGASEKERFKQGYSNVMLSMGMTPKNGSEVRVLKGV